MKKIILILMLFSSFAIVAQDWQSDGTKYPNAKYVGDTITANVKIPLLDSANVQNSFMKLGDLSDLISPNVEFGLSIENGTINLGESAGFGNDRRINLLPESSFTLSGGYLKPIVGIYNYNNGGSVEISSGTYPDQVSLGSIRIAPRGCLFGLLRPNGVPLAVSNYFENSLNHAVYGNDLSTSFKYEQTLDSISITRFNSDGSGTFTPLIVKADGLTSPSSTITNINANGDKALPNVEWVKDYVTTNESSSTGLEAIDEGNGIGWRLIARDSANYANIGANAIDLSLSSSAKGASGNSSTISGGENNSASSDYSTIGGGGGNNNSGDYSTIAGGSFNVVSGGFSTVSGGISNKVSGHNSAISGGNSNETSGDYSAISGGEYNKVSGKYSAISGGYKNTVSKGYSTVSGGAINIASEDYSTISGGLLSKASDYYATVGGGRINTASGYISTVSGGQNNIASGRYSTVSGGDENTASGENSAISGGQGNKAQAKASTVLGGVKNNAASFAETVGGTFSTTYSARSTTTSNNNDRLFNIGNGIDNAQRSDAFTILKSAQIGINIDNFEANKTGSKLQVNGTIENTATGGSLILKSPDEKRWEIKVDNNGVLSATVLQ